ncbi:MAG: SpoIVB peptidase [Clostridia bacterium]|nr:SpoIVB peptidase [Clostridia bacterium]
MLVTAFGYEYYTFGFSVFKDPQGILQNHNDLISFSPYKATRVEASEDKKVILGGESIGVNINIDGILVLGFSDFYGNDGKKHCPARESGIETEDIVTHVNGEKISSASQFSDMINKIADGEINLTYERNGNIYNTTLKSQKSSEDGQYRIGLWARDGTSGIGTLTFINPANGNFAALGHGVTDIDTGKIIKPETGSICYSSISGVTKGKKGNTGELHGVFISSKIGEIDKNNDFGIYGKFFDSPKSEALIETATRNEILQGPAVMYCCTDGEEVSKYNIEIEAINLNSYDNKSMVIKVTDENLIAKTGGIVQGMSGSPIVQNGKLIGAITHVMINNSLRGYGIFIDNMIEETE